MKLGVTVRSILAAVTVVLAMATGLETFLTSSRQTGRTTVEVMSPRGRLLYRSDPGELGDVQAAIASDAETLPVGESYVYEVRATTPDGQQVSLHQEKTKGKKGTPGEAEEHRVDALSTNTTGAALGHMTRALIETNKVLRDMARESINMGTEGIREARRMHARFLASEGEVGLARTALEYQIRNRDEWFGRADKWLGKVVELGQGALASKGMLPPAAAQDNVAAFKAKLTDVQRARIREIVGPEVSEAIAWASSPEALADVIMLQVGEQKAQVIMMTILGPDVARELALMCGPHWKARKEAAEAKAKAEAAAKEGGATS